jgi:hypothetical protein
MMVKKEKWYYTLKVSKVVGRINDVLMSFAIAQTEAEQFSTYGKAKARAEALLDGYPGIQDVTIQHHNITTVQKMQRKTTKRKIRK